MSVKDLPIPQRALDAILACAFAKEHPEETLGFSIQRTLFSGSQVVDCPAGDLVRVAVVHADQLRFAVPGTLVESRSVGLFDVRLVHVRDENLQRDVYRVVVARDRDVGVVVLAYLPIGDGDRAHEAAFRYAREASDVDLASDFDPQAHCFGERRVPRHW